MEISVFLNNKNDIVTKLIGANGSYLTYNIFKGNHYEYVFNSGEGVCTYSNKLTIDELKLKIDTFQNIYKK